MYRSNPSPQTEAQRARRLSRPLRLALVVPLAAPLAIAAAPAGPAGAATSSAFVQSAAAAPALSGYLQKKSALVSVPAATQVRATVRCPRGGKVVGGGAVLGSATTQTLNTSYPVFDERTWAVRVNNTDQVNPSQFRVYAVCVSGVADYQLIEGLGVDNPGGTRSTAQAFCPSGTVPLGGGGDLTSPLTTSALNSSRPIRNGWRVTAVNSDATDDDFVLPYVVCGQQPAGWQQVTGTASTLKPFAQGQAAAECPSGASVLSGGGQSSSSSLSVSMNSSAPSSGRIWQVFENNVSDKTSTLTPYAVCATAASR